MRLATLAKTVSVISFAAILFAMHGSLAQQQHCPPDLSKCDELKACAPYKDKDDPKYRAFVNCAAFGNPQGKPKKSGNTDGAYGLPFQSRIKSGR